MRGESFSPKEEGIAILPWHRAESIQSRNNSSLPCVSSVVGHLPCMEKAPSSIPQSITFCNPEERLSIQSGTTNVLKGMINCKTASYVQQKNPESKLSRRALHFFYLKKVLLLTFPPKGRLQNHGQGMFPISPLPIGIWAADLCRVKLLVHLTPSLTVACSDSPRFQSFSASYLEMMGIKFESMCLQQWCSSDELQLLPWAFLATQKTKLCK